MGEVAGQWADHVVVTSDNPRREDPMQIIDQVVAGVGSDCHVEVDRVRAIEWAIQHMAPKDVLLIAGKGHETEQVLADRTIIHDDRDVALTCLAKVGA